MIFYVLPVYGPTCIVVTGLLKLIFCKYAGFGHNTALNFERLALFAGCYYLNKPLFALLPRIAKSSPFYHVALICILYLI